VVEAVVEEAVVEEAEAVVEEVEAVAAVAEEAPRG
jgi:hypothetical protein